MCTPVRLDNGETGFICFKGRGKARIPLCNCGYMSEFLCDWPMGDGKTCDVNLCRVCALELRPELHYCPAHAELRQAELAAKGIVAIESMRKS